MWRIKRFEHSIVVLGAGFAGIECARRLERRLRGRAAVHVALVDRENHSVFQPLLPEVASASIASHHVVNPVRMLAPRVDFDCAEVERIDLEARRIHFRAPEDMDLLPMPFTHLVIALGLVPNLGVVPGMAAHGLAMKTVGDAYRLRNHVLMCLEMAANTMDPELRQELLTVVTVGAGFSGVETCAELHDMMSAALGYFPELRDERVKSVLVSSTERILPALSPTLSDYAARKLTRRGVEIRLRCRTTGVTRRGCFLDDKSVVPSRTVISTVGNSPHPVIMATALEKNRGRLVVDEAMRCVGHDNVWAIGDCAHLVNASDGEPCPPTAQFAVRQGIQCADNIVRALDGQPLQPFAFKQRGYAASLGHLSAVVELGPIRLSGFVAWWLWRSIYLFKLPGWYRKLKVCLDWTVSLLFPRDICQLDAAPTSRIAQEHYEPGQVVVTEGDRGDRFFAILRGEVEVVRKSAGEETLLARLGPGSHFGEEALLHDRPRSATVRALTGLDLLVLGRDDFATLTQHLSLLGETLRRGRKPLRALEAVDDEGVRSELGRIRVGERMVKDVVTLHDEQTLEQLCHAFRRHRFELFPVIDAQGMLSGVVSRRELHAALNDGVDPTEARVRDLLLPSMVTAFADDDLCTTLDRFHQHEIDRLCVVDRQEPQKLVGLLTYTDVLQARIEVELARVGSRRAATPALERASDAMHDEGAKS
jgi:NADH dehydrogenase